jgi:hypothetical protein
MHLSWMASRSNAHVAEYRIYVNGSLRASVHPTSYRVGRLHCDRSYVLSVRAYDAAGQGSHVRSRTVRTLRCAPGQEAAPRPSAFICTETSSVGDDLSAAIAAAAAGSVLCLNGSRTSYGTVTLSSVSKASDLIVQPVAGATVTLGNLDLTSVSHVRFSGIGGTMNVAGTDVSGSSANDSFDHLVYTACVNVQQGSASNLLFDHDRFDNLGGNGGEAGCPDEGRVQILGGSGASIRTTISNSHFGGEGPSGTCSDGIQIEGDGVTVGPGNEFTGITESVCSDGTHADPIQIVGSSNEIITGNYFHDNGDGSGGCMCHDHNPDNVTITNNVFASNGYAYSILSGEGAANWLISHNVFVETVKMDYNSPNGSGNVMRDNVWVSSAGGAIDAGSGVSYDHNLNSGMSGKGNITGTPVFVGGSNPSSYTGYCLAPRSRGTFAASDGGNMGIRACG